MASFAFSFLMSCQWEIAENIGEPLSIQDFFATPILGSLMGELFYQVHEYILSHQAFAESSWGKTLCFLANPVEGISSGADRLAKAIWGHKATGRLEVFVSPSIVRSPSDRTESQGIGGRLSFRF